MLRDGVSRRDALRTIGAGAGAASVTGLASAAPEGEIEVNVGFDDETGRRAAKSRASEVVREFAFDALTAQMPREAATALEQNPNVRYVEENGTMQALQTTPYGIEQVGADQSIGAGYTGAGVDVAVIDTGIDSDHEDLRANLGAGAYAVSCSGYDCNYGWDDDNGHGTHCAGTIGAVNDSVGVLGVAPEVTLHAVKVLDSRGSGSYSDIAAGIEYVADQGWDVGSLSLGGSYSSAVQDACEYAYNRGVLLVAAAGNSGPCTDCVGYPAALDECVAVSAVDDNEDLASFSSTGPEVEVAAPGVDVLSTYVGNDYKRLNGTSMACPHVAGVGAVLMANGYTHTEARNRIDNTARDIGLGSNEQGYGHVDLAAALGL